MMSDSSFPQNLLIQDGYSIRPSRVIKTRSSAASQALYTRAFRGVLPETSPTEVPVVVVLRGAEPL